jgi:hypothetical protein
MCTVPITRPNPARRTLTSFIGTRNQKNLQGDNDLISVVRNPYRYCFSVALRELENGPGSLDALNCQHFVQGTTECCRSWMFISDPRT